MAFSFKDVKSQSKNVDSFIRNEELNESKPKKYNGDSRIIEANYGKNGETRIIKWRPIPYFFVTENGWDVANNENGKKNYIKMFVHKINVGNEFLIENCPNTLVKNGVSDQYTCPICKDVNKNYDEYDADKTYNTRKAKLNFMVNAYIYSDSLYPENNGTIKIMSLNNSKTLFQVFDKIWNGQFEETEELDEKGNKKRIYSIPPIDIFSMESAPDWTLTIKKSGDYPDYTLTASRQDTSIDISEELYRTAHDISEFLNDKNFHAVGDIEERYNKLFGIEVVSKKENEPRPKETPKTNTEFNEELNRKVKEKVVEDESLDDVNMNQTWVENKKEEELKNDSAGDFNPEDYTW